MNITINGVVYQVWNEVDITRLVFALKLQADLTLRRQAS
jgi:hypothetical protein